jgi:hypothetical protein
MRRRFGWQAGPGQRATSPLLAPGGADCPRPAPCRNPPNPEPGLQNLRCRTSSIIIQDGDTLHGISVESRGVLTNYAYGYVRTYAGQRRDGYACGLGVLTFSDGRKAYAEHGPDGECDGRRLWRDADGDTVYRVCECGETKEYAFVFADGRCTYNDEACARDDPRLLALIAQVAPIEVRPAAPAPTRSRPPLAPKQSSDRSAGSSLPPQALAAAVATEVHPHAARRRWWPCDTTLDQPHCNSRPRSDACTDRFAVMGAREAPSCTLTTAAWCTPRARPGSSVAMP